MNTRREFLAGLAAAQLNRLERRGPAQRIIVLGAGLAGLCSAYELQNQGHEVTILEAQLRPGGRVRTLRENFAPGLYTEAGAEAIPQTHELTQHYARAFGLTLLPNSIPGMRSFYHVRGQRIVPDEKTVWPFDLTNDERKLGIAGLRRKYIDEANQQALAAGFAQQPVRAMTAWDALTPGAWLRSKGASPAAADLLTLGFGTDFGSAASFLLHGMTLIGSRMSYRIEGGNDHLPDAFSKRVQIRYGSPVTSVTQDDRSVHVSLGKETLTADRVVCTIPCPVIGRVFADARLSPAKLRAIREQNYSHTAKVFLQTRTRFWLKEGFSGNVTTDLPIERLTPDPGADPAARGALAAYPIGPFTQELEQLTEEARVQAALTQARQLFPALSTEFEGGISKCWGTDPWQRGSFALHSPGQIVFIEVLAKPEGRIHFAGEHTSAWTGWMQGALESARRVVQEINA
jgi:monoamine oxidase